jgi:hypothetical protein
MSNYGELEVKQQYSLTSLADGTEAPGLLFIATILHKNLYFCTTMCAEVLVLRHYVSERVHM